MSWIPHCGRHLDSGKQGRPNSSQNQFLVKEIAMRITTGIAIAITLGAASILAAADASYIGKWRLNPARSRLVGGTLTIEKTASGTMRFEMSGVSYAFNVDGKEYPTPDGGTASWKALDEKTWEVTIRMNGKETAVVKLSLEGNSLSTSASVKKPDGGTIDQMAKFARASGGPGFLGKWKSTEVKVPAMSMELSMNGTDGLTLRFPEEGTVCTAKFDGKDYPVTGPLVGNKMSFSLKRTGPRSFEMTEKLDGKALYLDRFSVSEDGNSLTNDATSVSAKEAIKVVYDRQ